MKIRSLLILTAVASSILGAVVVYLVLSVPNDIRADGLLKQARQHMSEGRDDQARAALSTIVQQYPRTDAAAAATVALLSLAQKDRDELARAVAVLRQQNEQQTAVVRDLQKSIGDMKTTPPPSVTVTAPQPAAKKAAPKKTTTKKKTTPKKKRRR